MRRASPRKLSLAIGALADRVAPQTPLAEVQRVWVQAVGPVVAQEATPTAERGGVLSITCRSSVWAQELDLMGPEVVAKLNEALGQQVITALRCTAATPRSWSGTERR